MRLTRKPGSEVVRGFDARLKELRRRHKLYSSKVKWAVVQNNIGEVKNYEWALEKIEREASRVRDQREAFINKLLTLDTTHPTTPLAAPRTGERMLLLVLRTKEERANIPGDLEEEFKQIAAKHGARYAKLWYYKQVAASAWPMVRKAVGWGLLSSIGAWIKRLI